MKKKLIVFIFFSLLLILCSSLLLFETQATFRDRDFSKNNVQIEDFKVRIVDDGFSKPPSITAGQSISKKVSIKNERDASAFIRVMLFPTIINETTGITFEAQPLKQFTYINLNTSKWKYGNDGYYYYLDVLSPNQTTEELIEGVKMANPLDSKYEDAQFDFEVKVEGINITKNGYREAWWNHEIPVGSAKKDIDDILDPLTK